MIDYIEEDTLAHWEKANYWRTDMINKMNEMIDVINRLESYILGAKQGE